jgi:hypothetical protein
MNDIQKSIFDLITNKSKEIENKKNTVSWKKFMGDYFVRVIKHYISKVITDAYKVTEPNVYISGFPIEYDLLIVNKNAKPKEFTYSFDPKDVRIGLELKIHGIFASKKDLKRNIEKIKNNFDIVRCVHCHINFIYLTFKEVTEPKRSNSIDYLKENRIIFKPDYKVFCLCDSRRNTIIEGQWEKFIEIIEKYVKEPQKYIV